MGLGKNYFYLQGSYSSFYSHSNDELVYKQIERAIRLIKSAIAGDNLSKNHFAIMNYVLKDLLKDKDKKKSEFRINNYIAEEMQKVDDHLIAQYLYHRYRYEIYPLKKIIDEYPPCVQIEPSSVCNFRCVFCYQVDKSFSGKSSRYMGKMRLDVFKKIVDQIENEVGFVTFASRGEPLLSKNFTRMLEYCGNKFVGLKINTNASLLTENYIHAILSSGVTTIVFSVDAADDALYSKFRVNGDFAKILKNIELFKKLKESHYPDSRIISRVSGVLINSKEQNIESMIKTWGQFVDQVSYVTYCPWENIYTRKVNKISLPCPNLWQRIFIWYDGTAGVCDCDYKSMLQISSRKEQSISEIWQSEMYNNLRKKHTGLMRGQLEPCRRCVMN